MKYNEKRELHILAKIFHEKFTDYSDIDYKFISNAKAKYVLTQIFRIPDMWKVRVLNDLERLGVIKRIGQEKIELLPI